MHDTGGMDTPDLINTAQAAQMLGVDRSTLTRWVGAGRIEPALVLPGRRGQMLFERTAVAELQAAS